MSGRDACVALLRLVVLLDFCKGNEHFERLAREIRTWQNIGHRTFVLVRKEQYHPGPVVVWTCEAINWGNTENNLKPKSETVAHLENNGNCLVSTPRSLPSPHLKYNTSDTPDVYLLVVPFFRCINDFGRHPEYCALHSSRCANTIDIVRPLGDTKI